MIPRRIPRIIEELERMGINFGVQIEMVADPKNPHIWSLLQIRPSPDVLRGCTGIDPVPDGFELLSRTLIVNKTGSARGGAIMDTVEEKDGGQLGHRLGWIGEAFIGDRIPKLD